MTTPAKQDSQEVARPLRTLIPLIQEEITQGREAGIPYFRRAGALLIEAKEQVAHGEWGGWLKRQFDISRHTAAHWMGLAAAMEKPRARSFSTLSQFSHPDRPVHHRPAFHTPITEALNRVNVDRFAQERREREREEQLTRSLGLQLIDIGYKALATKLHPDRGGSVDAMTRLNRVRTLLKAAL